MLFYSSKSKFSGFRSLWQIPQLWIYSIPDIICWKNLQASYSLSFFLLTINSKSSPPDAYSMIRNNYLLVSIIYKFRIVIRIFWTYFIQLDHIWVTNFLQNVNLSSNALNICLIFYFVFFKYLYCNLFICDSVSS